TFLLFYWWWKLKSIKVDEETYRLLLKLKYEHAIRGIKVTFSDLVKGILLGKCHSHKRNAKMCNTSQQDTKKVKLGKTTTSLV
nr:hypothetical protein [Candidatus Baldrarchaeota archaeon]